jgi:hypothetical protein
MKHRHSLARAPALIGALLLLACGPGSQTFQHGPIRLSIPGEWTATEDGDQLLLRTARAGGAELLVDTTTWDIGGMNVSAAALKGMIGSELNLEHGGVDARLTLTGNAFLAYDRTTEDTLGRATYTRNWVVATPYSVGYVLRADFSLRVPADMNSSTDVRELIEDLDLAIGEAEFVPLTS